MEPYKSNKFWGVSDLDYIDTNRERILKHMPGYSIERQLHDEICVLMEQVSDLEAAKQKNGAKIKLMEKQLKKAEKQLKNADKRYQKLKENRNEIVRIAVQQMPYIEALVSE